MTYFDLKDLRKRIDTQKLKVQQVREEAYKTTPTVSETSGAGTTQDKLGTAICRIDEEENKQKALEIKLEQAICKIPDPYIRKAINCKLIHRWSWNKIAMAIGGNNKGNSIRMMCSRYEW